MHPEGSEYNERYISEETIKNHIEKWHQKSDQWKIQAFVVARKTKRKIQKLMHDISNDVFRSHRMQ